MLAVILYIVAIGSIIYGFRRMLTRYTTGTLRALSGTSFTYRIGNNLGFSSRPGMYHGIDVILPSVLPHIYLDGKSKQGLKGPRSFMPNAQILQLEGGFNKHFAAYVVPGAQTLALSLLTPDVMETLIRVADGFDVEIYQNHLRIITDKPVNGNIELQAEILTATRILFDEIDHKLKSWTEADAAAASAQKLEMEDMPTISLKGKNFRLVTIIFIVIYGSMALLLMIVTYDSLLNSHVAQQDRKSLIINAYIIVPLLFLGLIVSTVNGWFYKFIKFLVKTMDRITLI